MTPILALYMKSDGRCSANLVRCSKYATRSSVVCNATGIPALELGPAPSPFEYGPNPHDCGGANIVAASNVIVVLAGALGGVTPRIGTARGGKRDSPLKCDGDRFEYDKLDWNVIVNGAAGFRMGSPVTVSNCGTTMDAICVGRG